MLRLFLYCLSLLTHCGGLQLIGCFFELLEVCGDSACLMHPVANVLKLVSMLVVADVGCRGGFLAIQQRSGGGLSDGAIQGTQ